MLVTHAQYGQKVDEALLGCMEHYYQPAGLDLGPVRRCTRAAMSALRRGLTPLYVGFGSVELYRCPMSASCDEVETRVQMFHLLSNCGLTELDIDRDGRPCETRF